MLKVNFILLIFRNFLKTENPHREDRVQLYMYFFFILNEILKTVYEMHINIQSLIWWKSTVAYLGHIWFYYLSRAHDIFYFVVCVFFSSVSCARLFYFYIVFSFLLSRAHDFFLFCMSFFLFYYLVRTTFFYFVCRFFFSTISCARHFFFSYVVFSFLLSRAHDFYFL